MKPGAMRARRWISIRRQVTHVHRHDAGMPIPNVTVPEGLSISVLRPTEIGMLVETWGLDAKEPRRRWERGDRCYLCTLDGQPVCYGWTQRSGKHSIDAAGRRRVVPPGEAWVYDVYTSEKARGLGIAPGALARMFRDAHNDGVATVWVYTTDDNKASQRAQLRAGLKPAYDLAALVIGPLVIPLGSERPTGIL